MLTRRSFFLRSLRLGGAALGLGGAAAAYGLWEASDVRIDRRTVAVPRLPGAFVGKTVCVLADLHHGPFSSLDFIHTVVNRAADLKPDLFALVGDYAHKGKGCAVQLPPCLEVLSELTAPLGVYAVPGNHDMDDQGRIYRREIAATPLTDLTNRALSVTHRGERLWLAGVDDLWWGRPDLDLALEGVPPAAAVVLLCHNPDFMEEQPDPRVGLALCGHVHGGQVYLPVVGSPWIPSRYGLKYRHGLVRGPASWVFVSRGLGESGLPLRIGAPPEINLLTLASA
jgi:predicted MPP superfamily phosphohydrolase